MLLIPTRTRYQLPPRGLAEIQWCVDVVSSF